MTSRGRSIYVSQLADVMMAQGVCRSMAQTQGFQEKDVEEIVLAVSEIGSNLGG